MNRLLAVLILGVLAWEGYSRYVSYRAAREVASGSDAASPANERKPESASPFKCDGRTHCSQMQSCEEAVYFIRHCPGTRMDGDNDGVPCETQWCR